MLLLLCETGLEDLSSSRKKRLRERWHQEFLLKTMPKIKIIIMKGKKCLNVLREERMIGKITLPRRDVVDTACFF